MPTYTEEELRLLRKLSGLLPENASKDAQITAKSFATGPYFVPDDPGFYTDLKAFADAEGFDPVALLVVLASESNFYPGPVGSKPLVPISGPLKGHDTRTRGIAQFTYPLIGDIYTLDEWDALSNMTAREQLPFAIKILRSAQKSVGRKFTGPSSRFETYLANAAPSRIKGSGRYNMADKLYEGSAWSSNLGLDHGPPFDKIGVPRGPNFAEYASQSKAEADKLKAMGNVAYAKDLAERGIIKGHVSLGDLMRNVERMKWGAWQLAWQLASYRYHEANNLPQPVKISFWGDDVQLEPWPDFTPEIEAPEEGDAGAPSAVEEPSPVAPFSLVADPEKQTPWLTAFAIGGTVALLAVAWIDRGER